GEVEVQRARRVHVLQVPVGDERDGDVEDVELVLLDEREQQVERSLELGQRDRESCAPRRRWRGVFADARLHEDASPKAAQASFIAARTLTIVSSAMARAFSVPSRTSSSTRPGVRSSSCRAARCFSSTGSRFSNSIFLQSTQPIPALRHSRSTISTRSCELYARCRW